MLYMVNKVEASEYDERKEKNQRVETKKKRFGGLYWLLLLLGIATSTNYQQFKFRFIFKTEIKHIRTIMNGPDLVMGVQNIHNK